jgi:hypothetical protein
VRGQPTKFSKIHLTWPRFFFKIANATTKYYRKVI